MFATPQKIGRSLMLPIAVLPAAGLLLRVGLLLIEWIPGHAYQPGDVVVRDKVAYECVQGHTAASGMEPSMVNGPSAASAAAAVSNVPATSPAAARAVSNRRPRRFL